jgi:hypothetical protein
MSNTFDDLDLKPCEDFQGGVPQTMPKEGSIKFTLKILSSFDSFCKFFDEMEIEDRGYGGYPSYKSTYDDLLGEQEQHIAGGRFQKWALGRKPYPKTLQEAMARTEYQHMDEFNDYYRKVIEPEASKLLNQSKASLDIPVIKYNDRQLGFFDFTRASAGLFPKYAYYSMKLKKVVEGVEVETYKEEGKYKYRLIADGSPCIILPMIKEGQDEVLLHEACEKIFNGEEPLKALKNFKIKLGGFSSTVKKSYVYQEVLPKPKNAVRLFISIGGNANVESEDLKWAGYLGVGLTQILEFLGYSVSIYFVYGLKNNGGYRKEDGTYGEGVRFVCFPIKKFQETLAASNLLYIVSDPVFFRIRFFRYVIKIAQFYKDGINGLLGQALQGQEAEILIKSAIFKEFSKIDPIFVNGVKNPECPFLYYIVANCHSEQSFREKLRCTILDVVNENRLARERSGRVSMTS